MTKRDFMISLSLLLLFFHCATTRAQSPAQTPAQSPSQSQADQAPAKAPSSMQPAVESPSEVPLVQAPPHKAAAATSPNDVTKILEKAGGFSVFVRLLKSTSVSIQIENQLNVSNSLTIFAPTNGAFSALKPGTLNSLSTEQKVQLVQYHILPSLVSLQNFQTLSNPVRTQASNTHDYPLNITVEGSWVNISTGIVNTAISTTVYEDNQLAIYKVDKVLLPLGLFAPRRTKSPSPAEAARAPAPAPTVAVNPKDFPTSSLLAPAIAALLNDASGAFSLMNARNGVLSVGVAVIGAVISLFA